MSGADHDPGDDDEVLVRPFLAGAARPGHRPDPGAVPDDPEVRPYVITRGRARGAGDLPWEALLVTTVQGRQARASFETARILRLCERMLSLAEVSARLRLPIGVTRVLVADLVADGLLEASAPTSRRPADDVDFLERLMQGVSAL
jgi:hypothetical protein